jgi:hypothetical protein
MKARRRQPMMMRAHQEVSLPWKLIAVWIILKSAVAHGDLG